MRQGHETVNFFLGNEVEHTPAYGMKTLFVVGLQSILDIDKVLSDSFTKIGSSIQHLYFGANQSFKIPSSMSNDFWHEWHEMIRNYLEQDYWCTLDLDVSYVSALHENGLCEHNKFIPMISVQMPHIRLLNYNATLKLDDQSMEYSNPGVWCHSIHELQNREVFTDWSKYSQDTVLK